MARKKRRKVKESKWGVQELGGYKVGDHVWGKLHDGSIAYGEIFFLVENDKYGPSAKIWDQINDGYRVVLLESCTDTPPKRGKAKLRRANRRNTGAN